MPHRPDMVKRRGIQVVISTRGEWAQNLFPTVASLLLLKVVVVLIELMDIPAGAMFIATNNRSVWSHPRSCRQSQKGTIISAPCREMGVLGGIFKNNFAQAAGGAVFATYPQNVWIVLEVRTNG